LDQLAKFHKQINGTNLNRFPSVDKRPLDLYKLKKLVEAQGGFDRVCKQKKWAEIGRLLGYSGKIMSSLSTSLKNSYAKWLLPYETYLQQAKPGVLQQQELDNGGPYTPSPGPSPMKRPFPNSPFNGSQESPAMRASVALNSSIQEAPTLMQQPPEPPRPTFSSGFTSVNPGGFTPVNAGGGFTAVNGGFTAVNPHPPPPPPGFAAVNVPKGMLAEDRTNQSTPQKPAESLLPSANNTPNMHPSIVGHPAMPTGGFYAVNNSLKRENSFEFNGLANGDSDSARKSKRQKKGTCCRCNGSQAPLSKHSPLIGATISTLINDLQMGHLLSRDLT